MRTPLTYTAIHTYTGGILTTNLQYYYITYLKNSLYAQTLFRVQVHHPAIYSLCKHLSQVQHGVVDFQHGVVDLVKGYALQQTTLLLLEFHVSYFGSALSPSLFEEQYFPFSVCDSSLNAESFRLFWEPGGVGVE